MNSQRALFAGLGLAVAISTSGCFATRRPTAISVEVPPSTLPQPAPSTQAIPEPRKVEPKSRYGNPPYYEVFGKRYYVLSSSADYVERGVASWYGPGFHKVKTSSGEIYDMYGMSAAHKTLPLPAHVRVTNLQNGRSVVVRVNDRGPFVGNRIIDLSYTAALKLDMLHNGTAMVEVKSLDVDEPAAANAPAGAPAVVAYPPPLLFLQAGAFADPANAERLATKLRNGSYGNVTVREDFIAGRTMFRVRIGPVANVQAFDRTFAALERDGVHDAHLALD